MPYILSLYILYKGRVSGDPMLAVVGVYGVVSYAVALRTQEIGVRMALGAQSGKVLAMILRQGVTLAAYVLLIGLALSLALSQFLKTLLFQVSAADPLTCTAVSLLMLAITVVACYIPPAAPAPSTPW